MLKLLSKLKPYRFNLLLVMIFLFVSAICDLALPSLMARIVNIGIPDNNTAFIIRIGAQMLAISIFSTGFHIASNYLSSKVAMSFGRDLRTETFSKVTNYSLHEADKIGTSSLITRNTNDIQQMQMLVMMGMRMMVSTPLHMFGGIIMAVSTDPALSLTFVVALPILLVIVLINIKWVTPLFKLMQEKLDKVNRVMREKLTGVRVIRAFNRIDQESERFNKANLELTQNSLTAFRRMATLHPFTSLVMNGSIIAIMYFGATRVDGGHMQTGDLMAFIQYAMQILFSLMMATFMFTMIPRATVSANRIVEVLELDSQINDPHSPKVTEEGVEGYIKFENVTFGYPGAEEPVLKNISFEAKPGETTAIIGSTGSGKSTIINLIPRFYDPNAGRILIDGVDIKDMKQDYLRGKIGFVPQKALLFTGTIAENIRYGKHDATEEEVRHAADIAQATEFIDAMEDGFESYLSQDATNVSGGQKQRISIARALVKTPEIYIFDDSFSALDFKTDSKLRSALEPYTHNSTVIIVAQRVSTVLNADNIIVLDEGHMVGYGPHSELIKTCDVYREIAMSQLSEEELA